MKKVFAIVVVLVLCLSCTAYAAVAFKDFQLQFTGYNDFYPIVTDSTSKEMSTANDAYSRLYVTTCNATKNCIYKAWYNYNFVSGAYYKKTTSGTYMYYNQVIPKDANVTLCGRTDSDETATVYVAGKYGAG